MEDVGIAWTREGKVYGQDFVKVQFLERHPECTIIRDMNDECLRKLKVFVTHDVDFDRELIERLNEGTRIVVHLHCRIEYYRDAWRQRNVDFDKILEKLRVRRAIAIFPSNVLLKDYAAYFEESKVVFNGIDHTQFCPSQQTSRDKFRKDNGIPQEHKIVFFTARLYDDNKGLDLLEKIAENIGRKAITLVIQYSISGLNAQQVEVSTDVAAQFGRMGNVVIKLDRDRQNEREIKFADLAISLSRSEVAPLVLSESLMCGVPFIATDSTKFYDELKEPIGGDYFEVIERSDNSLDILALKFIESIENSRSFSDQERESLAAKAREIFDVGQMVNKYREVYESCLNA